MTAPAGKTLTASLLLTVDEAAAELRISRDSVYRLISAGQIDTLDVGTGKRARTRISRDALEDFISKRAADRPARTA